VTFNLWDRNDHYLERVARFLEDANADVVVLEEGAGHHAAFLRSLNTQFSHRIGDNGLAILSKHRIGKDGRINRDSRSGCP